MTLTLTRDDFAHMTRLIQVFGWWVMKCACGHMSKPTENPHVLTGFTGWTCPHRGQPISPKAEDWYPSTVGTHYAGRPVFNQPVTPESIAEAKASRDAERRDCERLTGCCILEDGTVIHPSTQVSADDLALLEALEDRIDLAAARKALKEPGRRNWTHKEIG